MEAKRPKMENGMHKKQNKYFRIYYQGIQVKFKRGSLNSAKNHHPKSLRRIPTSLVKMITKKTNRMSNS